MKTTYLIPLITAAAAQELCGQFESSSTDGYIVNNNLWGQDSGTGSQCTTIDSVSSSGVAWHTTWTWEGEMSVKSYANAGLEFDPVLVSEISSIQSAAEWSYDNTEIDANVAYDLFTAADPEHEKSSGDYELMIWLGRYGSATPIGEQVGAADVGGTSWELWNGMNGEMEVYSFVAADPVLSFSADIKEFWDYLADNHSYPADSQYLLIVQHGTEPFNGGEATMTVSQFSASVA
ncbi:concanavalin A-like lectin/glucanase domain-containing protein [Aspergillus aurantiobrunneus]